MKSFKIPLIISLSVFFVVLLLNIISGNYFLTILLRSLISLVLTFGIIFGVNYVLTEILKIDFSLSNSSEDETSDEQENKVDLMVDDLDVKDMKSEESDADLEQNKEFEEENGTAEVENSQKDDKMNDDENLSEFNSGKFDFKVSDADSNADEQIDSNISEEKETVKNFDKKSLKEKLGIDPTTEDLVKAIRTKINKDG
jgi:hypothetical protein